MPERGDRAPDRLSELITHILRRLAAVVRHKRDKCPAFPLGFSHSFFGRLERSRRLTCALRISRADNRRKRGARAGARRFLFDCALGISPAAIRGGIPETRPS